MGKENVLFFSEDVNYRIREKNRIRALLNKLILKERKSPGEINVIICSDAYLLKINKLHLKRAYFTDIITFNYNEANLIWGDCYISIDRIKENAKEFNTTMNLELLRVIIHGILHLCGYDDKTVFERKKMRSKEDYYINLF